MVVNEAPLRLAGYPERSLDPAKLTVGFALGFLDFARDDLYERTRRAERSKPDEQLRVHRCAHVNNRRFGCHQSAGWSRPRILPPQREPARRSPMCLLDIVQTGIHADLFHPIWYLPFIGQYAVLAAIGLILHRRGYDRFFAWYQLVTLLVWALVVRRILVGAQ